MNYLTQFRKGFGLFSALIPATISSIIISTPLWAAEGVAELNSVLNIDELYSPMDSEEIYGETALELLEQLESKHYASVEIDDNFSSVVFDKYLDVLDGSKLYLLAAILWTTASHKATLSPVSRFTIFIIAV